MGRPGYKSMSIKKALHSDLDDLRKELGTVKVVGTESKLIVLSIPKTIQKLLDFYRQSHPKKVD